MRRSGVAVGLLVLIGLVGWWWWVTFRPPPTAAPVPGVPAVASAVALPEMHENTAAPAVARVNQLANAPRPKLPTDLYTDSLPPDSHTLFPRTPKQVYEANIDAANAGEARAMYWVSQALYECIRASKTPQALQENVLSKPALQPWWSYYEALTERCADLFPLIPGIDVVEKAKYWLEQSALAGDATAQAQLLLDTPVYDNGIGPIQQIKVAVEAAIKTREYPAYYEMQRYLDLVHNGRNPTSEAWGYVACKLHPGCDLDRATGYLEVKYLPNELDEVLQIVAKIEAGEVPQGEAEQAAPDLAVGKP